MEKPPPQLALRPEMMKPVVGHTMCQKAKNRMEDSFLGKSNGMKSASIVLQTHYVVRELFFNIHVKKKDDL